MFRNLRLTCDWLDSYGLEAARALALALGPVLAPRAWQPCARIPINTRFLPWKNIYSVKTIYVWSHGSAWTCVDHAWSTMGAAPGLRSQASHRSRGVAAI